MADYIPGKICEICGEVKGWYHRQRQHPNRPNPPKEKVVIVCETCMLMFEDFPCMPERGRRFCSRKCAYEYFSKNHRGKNSPSWKGRINTVCKMCGHLFEQTLSAGHIYCSVACANKDRDYSNRTGENTSRWKGGITPIIRCMRASKKFSMWRTAVLERDEHMCQECNSTERFLNVHHIIRMSDDLSKSYDVDNGVTLCVDCHQEKHPELKLHLGQSEINSKLSGGD